VEEATSEDMEAPSNEPPPPEPEVAVQAPPPPAAPAPSKLEDFSHRHQVSARAMFGKGYRLAFAYGEEEPCGLEDDGETLDATPCYDASPAFTDLDLSFGVTDGLEISALIRLGLEDEFTGGPEQTTPLVLGFGIRAYADPLARVKFFLGARVMYDLTEAGRDGDRDLAVRAEPGLQIEIIRYVAFFLQANATIGFLRWLRFEIDAGAGLQLRVP
jgi:hypothetical protein